MKKMIIALLAIILVSVGAFMFVERSLAVNFRIDIVGTKGNRELIYYDPSTNYKYSIETLIEYYDISPYMEMTMEDGKVYFYLGKEINESTYKKNKASYDADKRAISYGSAGYRVHSTEEAINSIKDIYNNQKYGTFMLEFSTYEGINWNDVKSFFDNNYGVSYAKKNFYNYQQKGNQEPARWGLDISNANSGEIEIDATNIRITSDELKVIDDFANKLISQFNTSSDYNKIASAFVYLRDTISYYNDPGYVNNKLASTTSAYDGLINRKSACVGTSVTFSYLMDKMGIESYIVDNITEVNESARRFTSTHTYNIVKLNGKFYIIDIGSVFLGGISQNTLSDNSLPISTTSYPNQGLPTLNMQQINNYLNESKQLKTTTTKSVYNTSTTKKTKEFQIPSNQITSNKTDKTNNTTNNNNNSTTTGYIVPTTQIQIIEDQGTTSVVIIYPSTNESSYTNPTKNNNNNNNNNTTTTNTSIEEEGREKKETNLNYVLIPILGIVIVLYVIYKVLLKLRW